MAIKNISDLKKAINSDPTIKSSFQNNPVEFVNSLPDNPMKNKNIFLFVVSLVGLVLLGTLIIITIIILRTKDGDYQLPDFLVATASTALGALVGLLAPSPNRK